MPQVCYSWWDLASLSILQRIEWINRDKLVNFILGAQACPLILPKSVKLTMCRISSAAE